MIGWKMGDDGRQHLVSCRCDRLVGLEEGDPQEYLPRILQQGKEIPNPGAALQSHNQYQEFFLVH